MEISIKSIILFGAVLLTGLSAGLFYAWMVSVIPGTRRLGDINYLQTMQEINRAILNPAFFLIFFGSLILLALSSFLYNSWTYIFWLLLSATLCYLLGTFLVTVFGNVPLNNSLDALLLDSLSMNELSDFRQQYELKWNRFHMVRTAFAVLSFILSLAAIFSWIKN